MVSCLSLDETLHRSCHSCPLNFYIKHLFSCELFWRAVVSQVLAERWVWQVLDAHEALKALDGRFQSSLNPGMERAALLPVTLGFISTLNFPVIAYSQYYICCVAGYARAVVECHSSRKHLAQGSDSCMKCNGLTQRLGIVYLSIPFAFKLWFDEWKTSTHFCSFDNKPVLPFKRNPMLTFLPGWCLSLCFRAQVYRYIAGCLPLLYHIKMLVEKIDADIPQNSLSNRVVDMKITSWFSWFLWFPAVDLENWHILSATSYLSM